MDNYEKVIVIVGIILRQMFAFSKLGIGKDIILSIL